MRTLAQTFSMLPFAPRAQRWLDLIERKQKDIFWQLENRRIVEVSVGDLGNRSSFLGFVDQERAFYAGVSGQYPQKLGFYLLGESVASTFFYQLKWEYIKYAIKEDPSKYGHSEVEGVACGSYLSGFVNFFAKSWAEINTVEKMRDWCSEDTSIMAMMLQSLSEAREV